MKKQNLTILYLGLGFGFRNLGLCRSSGCGLDPVSKGRELKSQLSTKLLPLNGGYKWHLIASNYEVLDLKVIKLR